VHANKARTDLLTSSLKLSTPPWSKTTARLTKTSVCYPPRPLLPSPSSASVFQRHNSLGDAFLLAWKFAPETLKERIPRVAEKALFSFLRTALELRESQDLIAFANRAEIQVKGGGGVKESSEGGGV
jgi:hypothetical protein